MGDRTGSWDCGFKKEDGVGSQTLQINGLRIKYLTKILLSEMNIHKKRIIKQSEAYANKSNEQIEAMLKKGWEKREGRI